MQLILEMICKAIERLHVLASCYSESLFDTLRQRSGMVSLEPNCVYDTFALLLTTTRRQCNLMRQYLLFQSNKNLIEIEVQNNLVIAAAQ